MKGYNSSIVLGKYKVTGLSFFRDQSIKFYSPFLPLKLIIMKLLIKHSFLLKLLIVLLSLCSVQL